VSETPARQRANIRLAGAHNFRDLGGLPTNDGRHTGPGLLFRSDSLSHLTDADVDSLRELGIRTVIDLRAAGEIERDGRGPLAAPPVAYVNLPLFLDPVAAGPDAFAIYDEDLGAAYVQGLCSTSDAAVAVLEIVARADARPLIFHCNAGKDRTGVIAALILGCVGVTREAIIDDYAETQRGMEPILARYRKDPTVPKSPDGTLPGRMSTHPDIMSRFLDMMDARFGGSRLWARTAGVAEGSLVALERALLA